MKPPQAAPETCSSASFHYLIGGTPACSSTDVTVPPSRDALLGTVLQNRATIPASRRSGMFPAEIRKGFLDTGLKLAGTTKGNLAIHFCDTVHHDSYTSV